VFVDPDGRVVAGGLLADNTLRLPVFETCCAAFRSSARASGPATPGAGVVEHLGEVELDE
jgi:hypothetical protein